MNRSIAARSTSNARRMLDRLGLALALSILAVGNAMAQTTTDGDPPASLADAAAFMQTKGGIALAVSVALTLIILGLKGTKLPRRA